MNFPNHGTPLWYYVAVNLIPYNSCIVNPMPNNQYPYILAHYSRPLHMISHCRFPSCLPFLDDIINVLHTSNIPTLYFRGYGPNIVSHSYKPNYFLVLYLRFFKSQFSPCSPMLQTPKSIYKYPPNIIYQPLIIHPVKNWVSSLHIPEMAYLTLEFFHQLILSSYLLMPNFYLFLQIPPRLFPYL